MRRVLLLVSLIVTNLPAVAWAQGKAPWEEYGKRIKASESVSPLGSNLFGDQVSLSNGALSFSITDVSLPGNSGLPVALTRTYQVRDQRYRIADGMMFDWDIEVPSISAVHAGAWVDANGGQSRCSVPGPPPSPTQYPGLHAIDFWQGAQLNLPGASSGELLVRQSDAPKPTSGGPWIWMTNDQVHLSCLPTIQNGSGEGFLAITPDGTKIWFDRMAQHHEPSMRRGHQTVMQGGAPLSYEATIRRNVLLATRVEDRFGNYVTYTYTNSATAPARLTQITANDGRSLTLSYNAQGAVSSVSDGTRTWNYAYGTTPGGRGTLTQVTQPDTSQWAINFAAFTDAEVLQTEVFLLGEIYRTCTMNEAPLNIATQPVGTITHPSGASGSFQVSLVEHGRSKVPVTCNNVTIGGSGNDKNDDTPFFPIKYYAYSLKTKTLTGPGLAPMSWSYAYTSGANFVYQAGATMQRPVCNLSLYTWAQCIKPPCQSDACAGRSTTVVTGPGGTWTRYRHGNTFQYDEGKLISVEEGSSEANILRSTHYAYDLSQVDGAYKARWGLGQRGNGDSFPNEYHRPMTRVDTHLQGQVFTWRAETFDAFARPLGVVRESDLPVTYQSRQDQTEYEDNLSAWVIGQVRRRLQAGQEVERTDFNAQSLPWKLYANNALVQTLVYNADGTIASVTDPLNNTTALANWYRGLPRLVTFPDATTMSATVDPRGWVTSVTNEVGATTSYSYDALGRITQVAYPTGDPVSWTPATMSFEKATASAFGLPAGHWRHTTNRGNFRKEVYYDALWRPVIQREWEVGNSTATIRYSGWAHDHANRVTFAGYPRSSASSLASFTAGTTTTYDALGRVTRVEQDSELGDLVTHTEYLAGFKTRVTNPRGYSTTTSYRTFDDPSAAKPFRIEAPGGVTTSIWLDLQDKPFALIRTGTYEGQTVTARRDYVYDDQQRLCKRVEPETGATFFSYDAAGNLAWTAEGQALISLTCDRASVAASEKTLRSYDTRNRLVLVDYPDSTPDVTTTYTPDGKVATIGRDPTLLSYTYNKLGLLTSERVQKFGAIDWLTSHSYTTLGHLAATTYPSGHQVAFAPNALGQATQAGTYATGAKYHPNGALAEFTYGNGIVHTLTQNLRQLPERSRDALGANVVLDDSYDYDANGNVAAISDGMPGQPGNRDMAYDELDRLVSAIAGAAQGGNGTFAYDPLDNLRLLDQGSREFRYFYDANNRLAEIKSPTGTLLHTFGYDARGNTTSKDSGTLTFDRENRLTESALPTATTYVYDGLGRRVREFTGASTYFYYSHEGKLLYDSDLKTSTRTDHIYLSGSLVAARRVPFGTNTTPEVTYQHTDALGTPVAFTNAAGTVVRRERMTAWGEPADGTWTNGPGYTGHQMDAASKLVYMQQRYYDPSIGRFLTVDPVTELTNGDMRHLNRYAYAYNSPFKFTDPDGRAPPGCGDGSCEGLIIGGPRGERGGVYRRQVRQRIEEVRTGDSENARRIRVLEDSENAHRILPKSASREEVKVAAVGPPGGNSIEGEADALLRSDGSRGPGAGSVLYYDPNQSVSGGANGAGTPSGILAHELTHSYDRDQGQLDRTDLGNGDTPAEQRGREAERNHIRARRRSQ